MKSIQLKINKPVPPHMQGQVVTVQVDDFGTPVKKFWRDRLRDAEVDSCVEIIEEKKSAPKTKKESHKEESQ